MIPSLFSISTELEKEFDSRLESIRTRLEGRENDNSISVNIDFPNHFVQQSSRIARGSVKWRKFFSDPKKDVYAAHAQMKSGASIRPHYHPDYHKYLYVVEGKIIVWLEGGITGEVVVPPDKQEELVDVGNSNSINGWFYIEPGETHWTQALDDTNLIMKFIRA